MKQQNIHYSISLFLLLLLLSLSLPVSSQSKMDLPLLRALNRQKSIDELRPEQEQLLVSVILAPEGSLQEDLLQDLQATIVTQIGRVVSLKLPVSSLERLTQLPSIERIESNRRHQLTCHNTRVETGVSLLHEGFWSKDSGLGSVLTGRGVLLGIIDTGIEYNHLNFRNPDTGATRLKGAVLYRPEEGSADSIRECFFRPEQIDTLTTDNFNNAHGTHTAGVAGGSYRGLGEQGMAPEADLMLCGTSVLEDDRLIDALKQTFARAEELGEPCVVNLSIGNPIGWKDGKSPLCLVCDSLTQGGNAPGRIIVFSAGNDGAKEYVSHHQFRDTLSVYTLLQPHRQKGESFYYNPNLDVYCSDSLPLQLDYLLYDTLLHEFRPMPFEQHLLDTIEAGHDFRRHLILDADTCDMRPYPNCLLAGCFRGQIGSAFTLYYINNEAVSYALLPGGAETHWLEGTSVGSISDLCTTPSVLSVGAYSAVDTLVNVFGRTHYPLAEKDQVCSFSSYGYSLQGQPLPDVLCPGASVVSSYSRFWEDKITYYYTSGRNLDSPMMHVVTPDPEGPTYYWIHAVGTSQSSPVLAGIIALWLQACPTLTVNQIRDILRQTSRFDEACVQAPRGPLQAGMGKVDAVAGLQAVLALADLPTIEALKPTARRSYNLMGQPLRPGFAARGLTIMDGRKVWQK